MGFTAWMLEFYPNRQLCFPCLGIGGGGGNGAVPYCGPEDCRYQDSSVPGLPPAMYALCLTNLVGWGSSQVPGKSPPCPLLSYSSHLPGVTRRRHLYHLSPPAAQVVSSLSLKSRDNLGVPFLIFKKVRYKHPVFAISKNKS